MKIIITENQLKFINEALGVPDNILDAAEMLYDIVERDIKSIDSVEEEYEFDGEIELELGDKHKVMIDSYELKVKIEDEVALVGTSGESQIHLVKYEMIKNMVETILTEDEIVDEKMGFKTNGLVNVYPSVPNTLTIVALGASCK